MELSKMFGVERETDFMVKSHSRIHRIRKNLLYGHESIYVKVNENQWVELYDAPTIFGMIADGPDCITHLPPPLTDEQRVVLMSLFTMGARYMVMTTEGWKRCFVNKPRKELNRWTSGDTQVLSIAPKMANCLDTLINLSDPEPFDIGKALGVGE